MQYETAMQFFCNSAHGRQNGFQTVKSKKTWLWRLGVSSLVRLGEVTRFTFFDSSHRSYYPLHVAVKKNDIETVRLLLVAGGDWGMADVKRVRAFQHFAVLPRQGADTQKQNHKSETCWPWKCCETVKTRKDD